MTLVPGTRWWFWGPTLPFGEHLAIRLRNDLGVLFKDGTFTDLFPALGQARLVVGPAGNLLFREHPGRRDEPKGFG